MLKTTLFGSAFLCAGFTLAIATTWADPPKVIEKEVRRAVRVPAKVIEKEVVEEPAPGGVEVRKGAAEVVEVHEHDSFLPHRASELMGMTVMSAKSDEIGVVKDLVLDCGSGRVRYVVVAFSSFSDLGDRLFAMPWAAFRCTAGPDKTHILTLDVTEKVLLKAPSFTVKEWPDFTSTRWVETNDVYFRENLRFPTRTAENTELRRDIRRESRDLRIDSPTDIRRDRPSGEIRR